MISNDLMMQEIKAQSQLFGLCATELIEQARKLVRKYVSDKVNRVYVTGCGDSFFAGIACKETFLRLANIRCEVYQAMEFSRYVCPIEVDQNALVLSISTSGKVARTCEAAMRARQKGAVSIAVTGNEGTPLAKASTAAFTVNIPNVIGMAPGTRSYAASQLSLICIALALGQERNVISSSDAAKVLSDIGRIGDAILATVDKDMPIISSYVDRYCDASCPQRVDIFHVLGNGPNSATAQFGSMKLLESCSFSSIPTGIEEWAHSQYFVADAHSHVIFIAPKGASRDRALEVLHAIPVVGATSIVICPQDDEKLCAAADVAFPICLDGDVPEWLSHLIYAVPLEMLSMLLSNKLQRVGLDFEKRPWLKEENFRQIYDSKITLDMEERK
ncbi:MAG: SIS domain-containing protein [Eubacteriales bacterium]|nr:SIS domain-containing protein [Eubacteriales bacterium]